jgi:hypothetical protein
MAALCETKLSKIMSVITFMVFLSLKKLILLVYAQCSIQIKKTMFQSYNWCFLFPMKGFQFPNHPYKTMDSKTEYFIATIETSFSALKKLF